MTAVNPTPPNATTERDPRPYEPSMEEILASIRRIIADDQSLPGRQDVPSPAGEMATAVRSPEPELTTVHVLRPAPEPVPVIEERASATSEMLREHEVVTPPTPPSFAQHGSIAPQYATPEGPVPTYSGVPATAASETHASFDHDPVEPRDTNDIDVDPALHHDSFADHHPAYEPEPAYQSEVTTIYDEPLGRHEPTPFEPPSVALPPIETAPLFSAATDQSITSAFNTLAASRLPTIPTISSRCRAR